MIFHLFVCFVLPQKDVRDIFTPVQFEVSYSLRESNHRASSKTFPPLKPILQQSAGHQNTITNQVPTGTSDTNQLLTLNQPREYPPVLFQARMVNDVGRVSTLFGFRGIVSRGYFCSSSNMSTRVSEANDTSFTSYLRLARMARNTCPLASSP